MSELKHCPFCGSEVHIEKIPLKSNFYRSEYDIHCPNPKCNCRINLGQNTTRYLSRQEASKNAIEAWNTRALTPAQEHAEELALLLFDLLFACLCGSLQEKQTLLDRAEALLSDIKLQELQEKIPALRKIKAQREA